mgnify:CR=1 FL=1
MSSLNAWRAGRDSNPEPPDPKSGNKLFFKSLRNRGFGDIALQVQYFQAVS